MWRDTHARRTAACATFRAAFAPDLAAMEADTFGGSDPADFLRAAYVTRHLAAVDSFLPYVPRWRRKRFTGDWNRYRYGEQENGAPETPETASVPEADLLFLDYNAEFHLAHPGAPRELVIKRLHKLLSHANET